MKNAGVPVNDGRKSNLPTPHPQKISLCRLYCTFIGVLRETQEMTANHWLTGLNSNSCLDVPLCAQTEVVTEKSNQSTEVVIRSCLPARLDI